VFRDVLHHPDVEEVVTLAGHELNRSERIGFMAYHGGGLELMTDVIARRAAELSGASYYGLHQPPGMEVHFPSISVDPSESEGLQSFLDHVHTVVTIHGFGRRGFFSSLLLGGQHRALAEHIGVHLRRSLPAYDIITDLDVIPTELRGLHPRNPVNVPPGQGVQIELPPRVRGTTPLFWDWEGPDVTPHTRSLIDGLATAVQTWTDPHGASRTIDHDSSVSLRR
jgi:phage replication-related protein YjqB (UPF0714/DUF867 family)